MSALIRRPLTRMALLSIVASLVTLALKFGAYFLTGSVGLLSDAVESTVNLIAALTALGALWYAAKPVDRSHNYGHEKIEFFASGVEGTLILIAAGSIAWYAGGRLLAPRPVEEIGLGAIVSLTAAAVNLGVARLLLRVAREHDSLVLAADGRHLMTDVLTSGGVIAGLALVRVTGIERLDPLLALAVALNIVRTGIDLVRTAFHGLMDRALPSADQAAVRQAIERQLEPGDTYHALRTRQAGARRFVDFHLLVPGRESVAHAHEVTNRIERAVAATLPRAETTIHVEPVEERAAWEDSALVALEGAPPAAASGPRLGRELSALTARDR